MYHRIEDDKILHLFRNVEAAVNDKIKMSCCVVLSSVVLTRVRYKYRADTSRNYKFCVILCVLYGIGFGHNICIGAAQWYTVFIYL